jgi:RNase P subunit RPR2
VQVSRRFDVKQVGPREEQQTCRSCGAVYRFRYGEKMDLALVKKLISYREKKKNEGG